MLQGCISVKDVGFELSVYNLFKKKKKNTPYRLSSSAAMVVFEAEFYIVDVHLYDYGNFLKKFIDNYN